jgi:tRNA (guanosine-2'-O-)-methyltransferase
VTNETKNAISDIVPAVDRRQLAREHPPKTSRWPRTERRQRRIEQVLARRQCDLTVVLENVHDPHNVSAVLRSCDSVGVLTVHTIYAEEESPQQAFARTTSASAAKWIAVQRHESVAACYEELRTRGFLIAVTALTADSRDLYEVDLSQPIALVFGNEMRGVSDDALNAADLAISIPMMGMVQSLNISVACAVTLYEALRQRRLSGGYDTPTLSVEERSALVDQWLNR